MFKSYYIFIFVTVFNGIFSMKPNLLPPCRELINEVDMLCRKQCFPLYIESTQNVEKSLPTVSLLETPVEYKCTKTHCSRRFDSHRKLTKHIHASHVGRPCRWCDKIFVSYHLLTQHRIEEHKNKMVQCAACCSYYVSTVNLNKHLEKKHTFFNKS